MTEPTEQPDAPKPDPRLVAQRRELVACAITIFDNGQVEVNMRKLGDQAQWRCFQGNAQDHLSVTDIACQQLRHLADNLETAAHVMSCAGSS